jgi:hypothetical protein
MRQYSSRVRLLTVLIGVLAGPAAFSGDEETKFLGDWKGDLICSTSVIGCRNEKVTWHIGRAAGAAGIMEVRSERLESGKPVAQPPLRFRFDTGNVLISEGEEGTWRLTSTGTSMEGTFARPNGLVFRRLALRRL